jgi:hypothetical protein
MQKGLELDLSPFWIMGKEVIYPELWIDTGRFFGYRFQIPVEVVHTSGSRIEKGQYRRSVGLVSLTEAEKHITLFHYNTLTLIEPDLGSSIAKIKLNDLRQILRFIEHYSRHNYSLPLYCQLQGVRTVCRLAFRMYLIIRFDSLIVIYIDLLMTTIHELVCFETAIKIIHITEPFLQEYSAGKITPLPGKAEGNYLAVPG